MIIKKVNIVSAGKLSALFYAIVGFIVGITFLVLSMLGYSVNTETGGVPISKTFGGLSVILFPLMYGVLGAVSGCILSFLYNYVARWTGGLKMDVE